MEIAWLMLPPLFARVIITFHNHSYWRRTLLRVFHHWTGTKTQPVYNFLIVWLSVRMAFHGQEMPAVKSHSPLWYNAPHSIVWASSWSYWSHIVKQHIKTKSTTSIKITDVLLLLQCFHQSFLLYISLKWQETPIPMGWFLRHKLFYGVPSRK